MYTSGSGIVNALTGDASDRWNYGQPYGTPATITYSFCEALPDYYYGSVRGFQSFNNTMKVAARQALACWAAAANITFLEVSDSGSGGQIRFGAGQFSLYEQAHAYLPDTMREVGGDVWLNTLAPGNNSPTPGTAAYETLIHEIGHALGLKHPGNYDALGGGTMGPYLPANEDNTNNTVMSYHNAGATKTDLRPYDRLAIAYLYGPRSPGSIGNLTSFGNGDDRYQGDAGTNYFIGNSGNDSLYGGGGNDGLLGGNGNDWLEGNDGNDTINGNMGADTVFGGAGNDSVRGGKDNDLVDGDGGNDEVYGDMGDDLVNGGTGNDTLYGGRDNDTLSGEDGSDELWGDRGNDTLSGGAGNDRFGFASESGHDVIADFDPVRDWITISYHVNATAIASGYDLLSRSTDLASGCLVDLGGGNDVLLLNIKKAQLSSSDFLVF